MRLRRPSSSSSNNNNNIHNQCWSLLIFLLCEEGCIWKGGGWRGKKLRALKSQWYLAIEVLLYVELMAGKVLFRIYNNNNSKTKQNKIAGEWGRCLRSYDTLERKAPREGSATVSGGSSRSSQTSDMVSHRHISACNKVTLVANTLFGTTLSYKNDREHTICDTHDRVTKWPNRTLLFFSFFLTDYRDSQH